MSYTILIVDDDKALLKMLKSYLEIRKYSVLTAEDGHEALKRALRYNHPRRKAGRLPDPAHPQPSLTPRDRPLP